MRKRAILVAAAAWAALLAAGLSRRAGDVWRRLPLPDAETRGAIESGDPGLHGFLSRVRAAPPPGSAVLLFVDDPAREDEFVGYRAAYELYPRPVRVSFRALPKPGKPVALTAANEQWAVAHQPRLLGMVARPKPAAGRIRVIRADRKGKLDTGPAEEGAKAPVTGGRFVPWLAGVAFLLVAGVWIVYRGGLAAGAGGLPGMLALGWVAGTGMTGWILTMVSLGGATWFAGWIPLAALLLALSFRGLPPPARREQFAPSGWDFAGIGFVLVASAFAVAGAIVPFPAWSNWDAWAVWDFKVKAGLEAGGVPVRFLRDPDYGFTHPEYPFGWPALQSFLAMCAGGFDTRLLRLLSPAWAACVPVLLATLLSEAGMTRGRWLIAGLVALLPAVLTQSSNGYVDWPVAAATTASLVFLLRACRGAGPAWPAVLFAGIAGNLKNEAAVFGIGVLAALVVAAFGRRVRWRDLAVAAAVWLALVAPWRVFASVNGLSPRDFGFDPATVLDEAPGRILLFVRALFLETLGPGLGGASFASGGPVRWSEWLDHLLNSWLILWFVVGAILALRWRRLFRPGSRELAIVLGVQVAAAALAYILTIRDPRWLLASSLDRLLLQWVPATVALAAGLAYSRRDGE